MEEHTIINGEPQLLSNRMITYDGLQDFLAMLKAEIPRMGETNSIPTNLTQRNYAFGKNNTIEGTGECNVALGGTNTLSNAHYSFVHGFTNETKVHSDFDIFTSPLKGKSAFNYALGDKNKLYGNYNVSIGLENQLYGNYSGVIGHSNIVHGTSCYVFGAGNKLYHNGSKNCYILGKESEIGSSASVHENLYLFGNYAKISNAKNTKPLYYFGQYGADASYDDNMIILANGTSQTDRNNLFQITYGGTIYDEYSDALYQKITTPADKEGGQPFSLGHLRHSMVAMAGNQAEWLLAGRTAAQRAELLINARDHGYNTPKLIRFHAGSQDTWANITCGHVISKGDISAQTLQCSEGITYKQLSCSDFSASARAQHRHDLQQEEKRELGPEDICDLYDKRTVYVQQEGLYIGTAMIYHQTQGHINDYGYVPFIIFINGHYPINVGMFFNSASTGLIYGFPRNHWPEDTGDAGWYSDTWDNAIYVSATEDYVIEAICKDGGYEVGLTNYGKSGSYWGGIVELYPIITGHLAGMRSLPPPAVG